MSKQTINIGASPNDGTGTPLRTSFDYTNQNFTELYTALGGGVGLPGATTQVIFNDGGTNLAGDAGLVYNKTTDALTVAGLVTAGSASITGAATVGTTLGVTGVSTLASAVVTGDLTARTTGLTVNSSGVGVGTSSQSSFLGNSPKRLVVGDGTQTPALTLYGGSAVVSGIYFADGTVGNEAYRGFIEYDHATDAFNLGTGGTSAITVNSSRNLAFLDGKGIDFSAKTPDGSGTVGSEVLNDYEEGTFTQTFTASAGTLTTVTVNSNKYTKIGRRVSIDFDVTLANIGTASGVLLFTLPFSRLTDEPCGAFREISVVGSMGSIYPNPGDATRVSLSFYNNTSVIVNGYRFNGTYSYNV